jgi:hypothetical protein
MNYVSHDTTPRLPCHNVIHFHSPTGNEEDLGDKFDARRSLAMFKYLSNGYRMFSLDILALDGVSAGLTHVIDGDLQGGATGDPLPQVCAGLTFQTATRGPRGRGRIYMGPTSEAAFSDGFASNLTDLATWEGAWTTFNTGMTADGYALCVASYLHEDQNEVSNIRANRYSTTQRRRMERLARH